MALPKDMIERETVEKIKDAVNIVEVVSEFVTLRKSGANYKGLCPFHAEKTPSFMVSPARGTCHCFGCGKGGNAITFIMEHEQMTYVEALRWLANKYHIEVRERELTDEEKREQSERESMFIVNEYALKYFEDLLHNHPDGVAVGMQYFRQRGIRDDIIKKFQLGFDLNDRFAFGAAALKRGYKEEFVTKVGICYKNDRGELVDRYAGRVIFPWIGVSGKVVGFGGRKLDMATKGVQQKYVNSPDSEIFHKDRELYGIWQAKRAIAKADCVYMVEGYTDVIAMHQCGIENVVANSGTALSVYQIRILHRFTENIVLLYDGDAAGIHAALRGTDMLLAEGMNLKVLLLPDGDDPDSFARKHTASDFRQYIEAHQKDFIQFKSDVLLSGEVDPLKRSEAINSVVESISMVVNPILRDTYLRDCSQRTGVAEQTLMNQMNKLIRERKTSRRKDEDSSRPDSIPAQTVWERKMGGEIGRQASAGIRNEEKVMMFSPVEELLASLIVRHGGDVIYKNVADDAGNVYDLTLAQFIDYNLSTDGLSFHNPVFARILREAVEHSGESGWDAEHYFIHHDDIAIARVATELSEDGFAVSPPALSRKEEAWMESLRLRAEHLVLDFRMDYLEHRLGEIKRAIASVGSDAKRLQSLMEEFKDKSELRNALARKLGSNIIV